MKSYCRRSLLRSALGRMPVAAMLLVLVAATPVACSSSDAVAPDGRPTGKWSGSVVNGAFTTTLNLLLAEDATGRVTGNGALTTLNGTFPTGSAAVSVAGTFVAPNLSVSIASQAFFTLNLAGRISGSSLTAVLNGSGFFNEAIVLSRQ